MDHNVDNDKIAVIINTNYIKRVKAIVKSIDIERKRFKLKYDFMIPPIRIVDSDLIPMNGYQIKVKGKLIRSRERILFKVRGLISDIKKVVIENIDLLKAMK